MKVDGAETTWIDPHADLSGALVERFIVPPFSVLDTRQGYWQERRRWWLGLGLQSELGREATSFNTEGNISTASGTSIFDPVLCELAYRWFCPDGGTVLDPFAGGSVRGIVAAYLGHPYLGIDLSARQVDANRLQAVEILTTQPAPRWIAGDSNDVLSTTPPADFIFTCPPYYDLEVYSDNPQDLSAMPSYAEFLVAYRAIVVKAVGRLQRGRFACVVVSEIRGPDGSFRGLVPDTIAAFVDAGMSYYNEAIVVNSAGSLPLRVTKQFEASRKIGRTHQNVLVFTNGAQPRSWSYEREDPPDPQMSLELAA